MNTAYYCQHIINFAAIDRTFEWGGSGEIKEWVWYEWTAIERSSRISEWPDTNAARSATRNW